MSCNVNKTSWLESLLTQHQAVELICRWNAVWDPVARFVVDKLPEQMCKEELDIHGLQKLPALEIAQICNWLIEKIEAFSSLTKAPNLDAEQQVCTYSQLGLRCSLIYMFHHVVDCLDLKDV